MIQYSRHILKLDFFFSVVKKAKSQEERDQENAKRRQELEKRLQVRHHKYILLVESY